MRSPAEGAPSLVYLPQLASLAPECTIEGEEAHYLSRVVRARPGERVLATDGAGLRVTFEVIESRPDVRLRRLVVQQCLQTRSLTLAVGAPEGGRADWLIEKAAELGATGFTPLDCERGAWKDWRAERLERLAIAGLRQSLGCHRLLVDPPVRFADWIESQTEGVSRFEAAPDGVAVVAQPAPPSGPSIVAIGPSSGFSNPERKALLENGFKALAMAASRLRTETAGVAAAAWWAAADPSIG
ncbi:MAG: RsmE family RNA methyltransferase [Candidatus Eisenbacteria bacterium]